MLWWVLMAPVVPATQDLSWGLGLANHHAFQKHNSYGWQGIAVYILPFPQWSSSVLTTTWINPFNPHLSGHHELDSLLLGQIKKAEDASNCVKPLWIGESSDKLKFIYSDSTRYFTHI